MPEGYSKYDENGREMAVQVGNLYDHPTAGRHWYKKATKELLAYGSTQSEYDHCLFYLHNGADML
eukprot:505024-Pleurochrysis_carterae.AAC.1